MKKLIAGLIAGTLGFAGVVSAQESATVSQDEDLVKRQIVQKINAAIPRLPVSEVDASDISGLYQVTLENGEQLFVTADAKHFLVGDLYEIKDEGLVNLSEVERDRKRAEQIAAIDESQMIVFSPERKKASITVFTDVDCGYCRKLHSEIDQYLALGIEIRYLAFPRTGLNTESYDKIVSAWCADNPQQAMTQLKAGRNLPKASCANPVADQYRLGALIGVRGTPAVIDENGTMIGGYLPAAQMAQMLGIEAE